MLAMRTLAWMECKTRTRGWKLLFLGMVESILGSEPPADNPNHTKPTSTSNQTQTYTQTTNPQPITTHTTNPPNQSNPKTQHKQHAFGGSLLPRNYDSLNAPHVLSPPTIHIKDF
jgi:hypothetical protein